MAKDAPRREAEALRSHILLCVCVKSVTKILLAYLLAMHCGSTSKRIRIRVLQLTSMHRF